MIYIYIYEHNQSHLPYSSIHPFFLIHPSLCQLKNISQNQFSSTQIVLAVWSSRVVSLPGRTLSEKLSLSLFISWQLPIDNSSTDHCETVCPAPFLLLGSCLTWACTGIIHDITSVVSSGLHLTHSIQMIMFSCSHQLPQALEGLLVLKYFICFFLIILYFLEYHSRKIDSVFRVELRV